MKLHILAAPLLAVASARAQSTWYVDIHGSSPGSGTASDPYTSIEHAIHAPATLDGDTILVRPGIYVGQVQLDRAIVVRSTDGPISTQIRGDNTVVEMGVFNSAASATQLEGFTIARTGTNSGRVVRIVQGEIRRCIVIGNDVADGIYFADTGTLDHCVVTGCFRGLTEQQLYAYGGYVWNSIVWGNQQDAQIGIGYISYSVLDTVAYPNSLGAGVLRMSPGCFGVRRHDFHLLANSVCLDAGTPWGPTDPDGSPSDIGVFAFDANYAPFATYCTAKANSLGCVPAIGAVGNASFSSSLPFTITCANELNQKLGLIFHGYSPASASYQGGYLCVQPPVRRSALINSGGTLGGDDCSGVFSYDFNALIASHTDNALEPGREVFAQFWSRDPSSSFGTNRSDAIRFTVQP